jgi:kynurenine aminotransferase
VNTPHNPCGKVFTKQELEEIADIAKEFNLIVLSDEVVRAMIVGKISLARYTHSMTYWSTTGGNTSVSRTCRACGSEP